MEREKGSKKETKNQRIMVKQNKVVYPCDLKGSLAAIGLLVFSTSSDLRGFLRAPSPFDLQGNWSEPAAHLLQFVTFPLVQFTLTLPCLKKGMKKMLSFGGGCGLAYLSYQKT